MSIKVAQNDFTRKFLIPLQKLPKNVGDLGKLQVFGKYLTVYFLFGKMLSLLWQI